MSFLIKNRSITESASDKRYFCWKTRPNCYRQKQDCFAAARELLELFNEQCLTCLRACDYLCIDETLYPRWNQVPFKQFNSSNQAIYRLIFKSILKKELDKDESCLKKLRAKHPKNILLGHLKINSLRNKFEYLEEVIKNMFDVFLVS